MNPIIDLRDIHFGYTPDQPVFSGLNFRLYEGDRLGLIAPNGSGKTTLFHIVMGLLRPDKGSIRIFDRDINSQKDFIDVRRRIGLLFQDADDQLFNPTVIEDVAFGPLNQGKSRLKAIDIAEQTLSQLGLSEYRDRVTFKLSGGEKRLVSLATVLAMQPQILLLDEPTTGLDADTRHKIIAILSRLEISYILISHNMDFLAHLTDHVYTLHNGEFLLDKSVHLHRHVHAHPHGSYAHGHDDPSK